MRSLSCTDLWLNENMFEFIKRKKAPVETPVYPNKFDEVQGQSGRIDDVNKAQKMASMERYFRNEADDYEEWLKAPTGDHNLFIYLKEQVSE